MCLNDFVVNENYLFSPEEDYRIFYKVVNENVNYKKNKKAHYTSFFFNITYSLHRELKSDREEKQVTSKEFRYRSINHGIHVYKDKFQALFVAKHHLLSRKVLACKCYKKDYVAHNPRDAVFTKVTILDKVEK